MSPNIMDSFLEASRVGWDLLAWPFLKYSSAVKSSPEGNGQPVMVIPGFGAADFTTDICRSLLKHKGYTPYEWKGGINLGPQKATVNHMIGHLDALAQRHGQKVDIVGHSLGGIFARELARRHPDKVGHVVTLGSPFGIALHPESGLSSVKSVFELLNPHASLGGNPVLARNLLVPPEGVATTSLYTRHDGVVHWQSCINPQSEKAENIEIGKDNNRVGHCGLIMNEAALSVLFCRLAEPVGAEWKPFDRNDYPAVAALLRPDQIHEGRQPATQQFTADEQGIIAASNQNLGFWALRAA